MNGTQLDFSLLDAVMCKWFWAITIALYKLWIIITAEYRNVTFDATKSNTQV